MSKSKRIGSESAIGEFAVLVFMTECYRRGLFFIFRPTTFDPGHDLVLHNPHGIADELDVWKVQVKTVSYSKKKKGYLYGDTRRTGEHYKEVDIFAFWNPSNNGFWIVTRHELKTAPRESPRGRKSADPRGIPLKVEDRYWNRWELFQAPPEECRKVRDHLLDAIARITRVREEHI